jgi:hypothetical protein
MVALGVVMPNSERGICLDAKALEAWMTALTLRRDPNARWVGGRQIALSVVLWGTLTGTVAFLSLNGRLAADDYCNASRTATLGVAGATKNLYETWHGGWSADLIISIYGFLVLHLPATVGYLPFVLSTVLLLVLAARSAVVALGIPGLPRSTLWMQFVPAVATLLIVGFIAYARDQDLIFGVFLWQAASVIHLWPALLTVVLLVGVFELHRSSGWKVTGGLIIATIVVSGFNFTETSVLAAAAGLLAGGFLVAERMHPGHEVHRRLATRYAMVAAVSAICFVAMYAAPGTAVRRAALGVPSYSLAQKAAMFERYVGTLTGAALGRPALLLAVALGVGIAFMVRPGADLRLLAERAALVAVSAGGIGSLGIALAAAGEVASYPAPWHALALIQWWVVAAVGVGICLGATIVTALERADATVLLRPLRALTVLVPVLLSLVLAVQMAAWSGPLTARAAAWDNGNLAPIAGLADRDEPWIATCWSIIVRSGSPAAR